VADIQWFINGANAEKWSIQRESNWRPPLNTRSNLLTLPGKHGIANLNALPVFDEPQLPIKFRIKANTQAELEALANELMWHLSRPTLTLKRVSGGVTAEAPARLVSIAHGAFLVGNFAELHAILAIPGVFLRGAVGASTQKVSSDTLQVIENLTGSTGPITDPIIQVLGPATTVSITDSVTGTGITWAGTLASGQYLYLDPANLRAWLSSSASAWTAGTQAGTVDYPPNGLLQLWPNNALEVKAKVLIGGSNSATTKWLVRAGKSYV
jgi:hypothetical protein